MSLLFCDSFDHYTTVLQKWTTDAGTHTIGAFGTNGTNSVRSSSTGTLAKTLPGGSKATLVAGCNFRTVTFPNTAKQVIGFRDSGTDQCDVRVKLDGTLQVTRNGTVLGTGTTVLAANVFYFIELKVTFATGATGSATLRINNNVELTLTNVQTAASANATANQLVLDTTGSNSIADWDDLYCCDSLTANNNDFLGVLRVQVMLPDGAGNYAQWTPNAGTNFSRVNETPPDEDTTYNASSTLNQIDTFTFGNVTPATGTVKGVEVVVVATSQQARVTQEFVEVLERYAIPHVTQQPVEVVLTVTGAAVSARVTQQPVEAVIVVTAGARVTQMFAEALVASVVIPV